MKLENDQQKFPFWCSNIYFWDRRCTVMVGIILLGIQRISGIAAVLLGIIAIYQQLKENFEIANNTPDEDDIT